jgi:hypothetical protein
LQKCKHLLKPFKYAKNPIEEAKSCQHRVIFSILMKTKRLGNVEKLENGLSEWIIQCFDKSSEKTSQTSKDMFFLHTPQLIGW